MANSVKISARTGRVRGPNLSDPALKAIGDAMVAAQKDRWAKAVDADGQPAKKLSVRYAIIKQAVIHKRPKRDMSMTGQTIANFTLRKAADGKIRAENTVKICRDKARRANGYDQMIGLALTDVKVIMDESQAQYGQYCKTAWLPVEQKHAGEWVAQPSSYSTGAAANMMFVSGRARTRRPPAMGKP